MTDSLFNKFSIPANNSGSSNLMISVEKIVSFWKDNYRDEDKDRIAGIIGLDADLSGKVIGKEFPAGLKETTLRDYYEVLGGLGDKKLVYRTEVVKKYPPYPLFEGMWTTSRTGLPSACGSSTGTIQKVWLMSGNLTCSTPRASSADSS